MINPYENRLPRIYAYTTPGVTYHDGWLKIGYTATQTVDDRIKQQTHTAWIEYETVLEKRAPFDETLDRQLTDKDFHKFLVGRYKIKRAANDLEWFNIDEESVKKYFEEFCANKTFRTPPPPSAEDYVLRDEQNSAVEQTLKYLRQNSTPREFLWNAKPRFGKNLAVYEFIKQYGAEKILIVTNRPNIARGWYEDFQKFVKKNPDANYIFATNTALKIQPFDGKLEKNQRLIAFISLQDLKGAKNFGGKTQKLDWIKNFHWDILIVDESHEGIDTEKTKFAFENITRDFTLHLSGTPFKAIANEKFRADQIFNWSYFDEQSAKRNFEAEPNPYADLPRMNLFSYKLLDMIAQKISAGTIIDDENVDYTFDLNEFFSTDGKGKFIHEADVKKFLDALTVNEKFPFSTPELRDKLKHTFWLMYRVDSAKAMEKLLIEHEIFRHYKIIVAAGKEKSGRENLVDVKDAIDASEKTITLSVGQLTTGVTVPEWTAILILNETQSAAAYFQAAFRVQNPHVTEDSHKTNCYVFDFNPARSLELYAQFAGSLGSSTGDAENIGQLLNFFPVLAEDSVGKMVELDAEKIISLPQTIKVTQTVESGFMSNFLFNADKISRVFSAPNAVANILNKIPRDNSPAKKKSPAKIILTKIQTDENGNVIIDENAAAAKAKKIFKKPPRPNIPPSETAKEIAAAVKEEYKLTQAQTDSLAKKIDAKIADDTSAENIAKVQRDVVEQLEHKKAEELKRKQESDTRAILRGFARTIPSFIMAYGDENLTLKNFDQYLDDKIFTEITGITLAEFRFLRDGGELNGETFEGGIFNEKIFNAAIQEFLYRKNQLADYFAEGHDEDIFSYIPPQRTNQIFTPKSVVLEMIDALEIQSPGIFDDPAQKFFDPYIKSGLFIAEIVKRLYRSPALKKIFPDENERLAHILTRQVYGFAPTEIILRIAVNYIFGSRKISRANFVLADISKIIQANQLDDTIKKNFKVKVTILNINRVKKFGEVFTPPEIVDYMLDDENLADIWENPAAKILEPTAGDGAFLKGILLRKLKFAHSRTEKFRALASIYAVELQLDNLDAAKKSMAEIFAATFENFSRHDEILMRQILDANIVQGDIFQTTNYHQLPIEFVDWIIGSGGIVKGEKFSYEYLTFNPKFAVAVGNPPYQLDTKGDNKTYAAPIYHSFLQDFWSRCDRVMMIHPARCLFRAGGTPKAFIDQLLSDAHIKIIRYEPNSKNIFPDLDIKGGVAITYRDANKFFGAIKVFIPFPELKSIFDKVTSRPDFKPLSEIMRGTCIFHFTEKLHAENPAAIKKMSKGHDFDITTDAFENFPDIFLDEKPNDGYEYIQFYGLEKFKRAFKFIRRDYVREIPELLKYKVMIPAAYGGAGAICEKGPTMLVGLPLVGYTDSFIGVYSVRDEAEATAAIKFVKTKFARAMLGVLKATQHATPPKWKYVPQQDFSAGSDVPWLLPVAQIDEYLYGKYELTPEEINFIETNVKAMN